MKFLRNQHAGAMGVGRGGGSLILDSCSLLGQAAAQLCFSPGLRAKSGTELLPALIWGDSFYREGGSQMGETYLYGLWGMQGTLCSLPSLTASSSPYLLLWLWSL